MTAEEPVPGPHNVEIQDIPGHWDSVFVADDLVEAARVASYIVKRDWRVRQDERRVRILAADGREW
jgi:hypothetical protein